MMAKKSLALALVGLACLCAPAAPVVQTQAPKVPIPQPGVPQIMTLEGTFVRAAYNNEGYVIIGYQLVQRSIGEPWMLLEVGMTLRDGVSEQILKRDAISLETPDGKTIQMASSSEQRAANLSALQNREKVQRDSINYFPPSATRACRIGFFAEMNSPAMPYDEVALSNTRACLGRLYFNLPGNIQLRPALAQREAREDPHSCAIQDSHERRGAAPLEKLQGHQEAGAGRIQTAEEVSAGRP